MLNLLRQAIGKQQELKNDPRWEAELLPFAPPVLWFGDNRSILPKIVTIGANPSRREFLIDANVDPRNYHNYLIDGRCRFYVTEIPFSELHDIPDEIMEDIIDSFNNYFSNNPYATWFGNPTGGKVEAFMNGLGASIYNNDMHYRGIHIDLFPFATVKNFKKIYNLCNATLFLTNWAQSFLVELILRINPEKLIVFGISNYLRLLSIFNANNVLPLHFNIGDKTCPVYFNHLNFNHLNLPLIGLLINLGNPIGWSRNDLIQLGEYININQ